MADVAESFDVAYLVLSGTTTAARGPEMLHGLLRLGFTTVIAIPTPNASRVIALRELADVTGAQVVEWISISPSGLGRRAASCCLRRAASTR